MLADDLRQVADGIGVLDPERDVLLELAEQERQRAEQERLRAEQERLIRRAGNAQLVNRDGGQPRAVMFVGVIEDELARAR